MYWRVRKSSVDQMVRQYGVHVLLAFSVFMNGILIITRPNPGKSLTKEQKTNFETFARSVTTHLLDTNYISYRESTMALESELAPNVIQVLSKAGMLAGTQDELAAQAKALTDGRNFSAVKIEEVTSNEPNAQGMMPIDVRGVVAVHSSEESGPSGPVPFKFRYLIGMRSDPKTKQALSPIVTGFDDLSGSKPEPQ